MQEGDTEGSTADPGALRGLKPTLSHGGGIAGGLRPPSSMANIT